MLLISNKIMATKTYYTYHGNLFTFVKSGAKKINIKFIEAQDGKGYFSTDRKKLQNLIESDKNFGKKIFLSKGLSTIKDLTTDNTVEYIEDVTNYEDAIEYLTKNYNVDSDELKSPKNVRDQAKRLGIYFPNIR